MTLNNTYESLLFEISVCRIVSSCYDTVNKTANCIEPLVYTLCIHVMSISYGRRSVVLLLAYSARVW
jgi:hypothetical protein